MAPYIKRENGDVWEIEDGDGKTIATVQTEMMADCLLFCLLNSAELFERIPTYLEDEAYGEPDEEVNDE